MALAHTDLVTAPVPPPSRALSRSRKEAAVCQDFAQVRQSLLTALPAQPRVAARQQPATSLTLPG